MKGPSGTTETPEVSERRSSEGGRSSGGFDLHSIELLKTTTSEPSGMVATDTYGRGGDMGDRSVALIWPSAVDGRPAWPSD